MDPLCGLKAGWCLRVASTPKVIGLALTLMLSLSTTIALCGLVPFWVNKTSPCLQPIILSSCHHANNFTPWHEDGQLHYLRQKPFSVTQQFEASAFIGGLLVVVQRECTSRNNIALAVFFAKNVSLCYDVLLCADT